MGGCAGRSMAAGARPVYPSGVKRLIGKTRVVTAAVLFQEGRLLICQRPPADPLAGYWELPGGKVEPDETNEECLARELQEELGIEATIGAHLATSDYVYERGAIRLMAYRVTAFRRAITPHFHSAVYFVDASELDRFRFAPADVPLIAIIRKDWPRHADA